jgi:hypothetical protein
VNLKVQRALGSCVGAGHVSCSADLHLGSRPLFPWSGVDLGEVEEVPKMPPELPSCALYPQPWTKLSERHGLLRSFFFLRGLLTEIGFGWSAIWQSEDDLIAVFARYASNTFIPSIISSSIAASPPVFADLHQGLIGNT